MSAEKTPQLDLMMGETAKLSIAYAIDNFQKAEKSIGKFFQNRHTVLVHFKKKSKVIIWSYQMIRAADIPAVGYRTRNIEFADMIGSLQELSSDTRHQPQLWRL